MDDADLEERIAEVKAIKRFGEEELGLEFGNAFEEVDLKSQGMFYWLYASYQDRIECPPLRGWDT